MRSHNLAQEGSPSRSATTASASSQLLKSLLRLEQADSQSEGLGLGLAISKAIVEMHAGTIRAHSDGLGEGTTFVIELPIRESAR